MTDLVIIPIDCAGCGTCCMHVGTPPFHSDDREHVPPELWAEFQAEAAKGSDESRPCIWLDLETRRCRHYDDRPDICREFEVGGEACLSFLNPLPAGWFDRLAEKLHATTSEAK